MANQLIAGLAHGLMHPALPYLSYVNPTMSSGIVIDATGEKAAFVGSVDFKEMTGTKTVDKLHFLFGAVTKAGGSVLRASFQGVTAAAGPPMRPDETQDEFRDIANADAGFATNAWYTTGLMTSDGTDTGTKRTVSYGEALGVVIEFDSGGRLGADSVAIRGLALVTSGMAHNSICVHKTGGTWALSGVCPNVVLEFSDGTFGTLLGAFPASAVGSLTYNSGTAGTDEYALEFQMPGPFLCNGLGGCWSIAGATSDAEAIFYDGTTAGGTKVMEGAWGVGAQTAIAHALWAYQAGLAGTTYRLGLRPTSANNITLYYFDVAAAGHFQAHPGGESWRLGGRLNQGAWGAATTTRRPFLWPLLAGMSDGVGGGGGAHVTIARGDTMFVE